MCAILNCSWTALGSFPRPGEEAETVQQQGHPRFYSCFHCTHAANSSLCSRLLCRGDMWNYTGITPRACEADSAASFGSASASTFLHPGWENNPSLGGGGSLWVGEAVEHGGASEIWNCAWGAHIKAGRESLQSCMQQHLSKRLDHACICARVHVRARVCVWPHFFSRRVETVYRLQHIPQERWSLLCSQPQPLLYTRNPALWENKGRRQAATEGSVISKAVREDARARGSSGHFGFLRGRPWNGIFCTCDHASSCRLD